jgi:glucose/mannose-6-phosphate isomerase
MPRYFRHNTVNWGEFLMDLNNLDRFHELDSDQMSSHIDQMGDQLDSAWRSGSTLPLPDSFKWIERLVIAGMGGAAVSADLLSALIMDGCNIPVIVNRDYELPAHADGQRTLIVILSHSYTEESLSALEHANARGTQILAITTNDTLAARAERVGATVWRYTFPGVDRAAIGWTFGLLLILINRLGLVRDLTPDVAETVQMLRDRVTLLGATGPVVKNPAKRLAGQMLDRIPVIYGAGILAPVARRWKTQLNENSKTWAIWEELPEMNHNAVSGISFPHKIRVAVVFLTSPTFDHPRIALRHGFTKELYLQQGIAPDTIKARGKSKLAQMLSSVQFGDYVSFFLAMAYGIDPTPTPSTEQLNERLRSAE